MEESHWDGEDRRADINLWDTRGSGYTPEGAFKKNVRQRILYRRNPDGTREFDGGTGIQQVESARFRESTKHPNEPMIIRDVLKNTLGEEAEKHRGMLISKAQQPADLWHNLLKDREEDMNIPSSEQLRSAIEKWLGSIAPLTLLTINERLVLIPPIGIKDYERLDSIEFNIDPVWNRVAQPEKWEIGITSDKGIAFGGDKTFLADNEDEKKRGKLKDRIPTKDLKVARTEFAKYGMDALPSRAFLPLLWSIMHTDHTLSKYKRYIGFPDFPNGAGFSMSAGFGSTAFINLIRRTKIPPEWSLYNEYWTPSIMCLPWTGSTLELD